MSFWTTSAGTSATENVKAEGTYDAGGNMDPLPDNSAVLAYIEKAEWKTGREEDGSPEYAQVQWRVEKPEGYANRVVFQKLWLTDPDPNAKDPAAKRDKALAMFAKIDAIAGGKLAKIEGKPTNDQLALALMTKQAVIKVGVWEIGAASGNWVKALSAPGGMELSVADAKAAPKDDLGDDEIPF